ncbi:DUF4825 domain-containing protein [Bacillus paramycoides]|uniref:DUF4825 domain-containing protein n=1 Tax=Bacillus paramycoides TaxID=2026194 RepID=UPI001FD0C27C|nr:DUF4825 domain-containing protein [Bacillus paramycoides]
MKGEETVKRITISFISLLSLMILLSGCSLNADSKTDLFQYKNSYVGDNSAVGNIVKQLAHNKELNQISLETEITKANHELLILQNSDAVQMDIKTIKQDFEQLQHQEQDLIHVFQTLIQKISIHQDRTVDITYTFESPL